MRVKSSLKFNVAVLTSALVALDKIRPAGSVAEDAVLALINAVMSAAIEMLQSGKRLS